MPTCFWNLITDSESGLAIAGICMRANNGDYVFSDRDAEASGISTVCLCAVHGKRYSRKLDEDTCKTLGCFRHSLRLASILAERDDLAFKILDAGAKEYCAHCLPLQKYADGPPKKDQRGVLTACEPGQVVGDTSMVASNALPEALADLIAQETRHTYAARVGEIFLAWHVKGCSLSYPHREYPGTHALPSGRVELLYTLRCLYTTRANGWAGGVHYRLDNEGAVKECQHLDRGFRATASSDADPGEVMLDYQAK